MQTTDFDYHLPETLIAQHPTKNRNASRLLHLDGNTGALMDAQFVDLAQFIKPNDLLIFNDTRVIKARLYGKKATGGAVEILIERLINQQEVLAHVRASRAPKIGSRLIIAECFVATVVARDADLFQLKFLEAVDLLDMLAKHGSLPLPPYIKHQPDQDDETRYQTVFAKHVGAVAAPTAGLHFDEAMLLQLHQQGSRIGFLTLHVGAGTFQPVKAVNIADHKMHSERYSIPQETIDLIHATRASGGKITAVGTTALRALESAAAAENLSAHAGETAIFITPGYSFRVVDRLLTNFHLPKSTLVMLVSAFAGVDHIKQAYAHAVAEQYRFFSYGDAMLIEKKLA